MIEFPCDFTIKVFGNTTEEFETTVYGIIRKHVPDMPDHVIMARPSSGGKYQALSITIHVESKDQLDRIYQELSASPLVLMAL